MAIPEGYQFLAKLGIVYKGDYDERVTYNQYDAVYYNGSTYIALVDSPVGPPTADEANWQYMAQGFLSQVISSLTATDKNGVIGEAGATVNAQELINGISDDLKDKLDKTGDSSDTIVTFEQASERTNIISGESHKTIFGKIKKWFADMTAAAFAQIITSNTDLMATTVSGYLVDALAVKQQFDVVNSNLNVKYNEEDDYFYVFLNGSWVKTIKAYAVSINLITNWEQYLVPNPVNTTITIENGLLRINSGCNFTFTPPSNGTIKFKITSFSTNSGSYQFSHDDTYDTLSVQVVYEFKLTNGNQVSFWAGGNTGSSNYVYFSVLEFIPD